MIQVNGMEGGELMDQTMRAAIVSAVSSGDMARAVRTAHGVLEAEGHYDGYFSLVTALLDHGNAALATQYFAVLRDALPTHAGVAYGYGLALQRTDRLEEAILQWKGALELAPQSVDACRNVAMGLIDKGRDDEAAVFLQRLTRMAPNDAGAPFHLGNIAFRNGAFDDACALYREALRCDANFLDAWINLGEAERSQGRLDAAEICFRQALSLSPDARQAHFNLAGLLLEQGRWREGFEEFQWRDNLTHIPPSLARLPLWSVQAPADARVALWNDQGLGDAMLFLRYASRLKARGAQIIAVLPPALTRLAVTTPGVDAVYTFDQSPPVPDFQAPIASLPHLLDEADPAWAGPYFRTKAIPPPNAERLSVGLVWAAGVDSPNGRIRSIPLAMLAPWTRIPDIDWFSLQLGDACAEIHRSPWDGLLHDMSSGLNDFADTATILSGLDLVISVDTSVAHLAGALGRAVWILLPRPCDWKWRGEGSETVWYPTARLFRQGEAGDWRAVVSLVAEALRAGQASDITA
jgi:tetratricopeptide (TPR) repeat protein